MALKVYPGAKNYTHEISLSDGVRRYGLRLKDGSRSLQEIPMTPSTVHFSGGGTKFGDWEPGMSHIEQRTWEGGRGLDSFVDDATRYFDAKNAWTLTPGKVFPVPAWKFSNTNGLFSGGYQNLPGDMGWHSLVGDRRTIAHKITHSAAWAGADTVYLWVRRVGAPGNLDVFLYDDDTGEPGSPYTTVFATDDDDLNENEVTLIEIDVSSVGAFTGTESWIMVQGQAGTKAGNHWEVGVDIDGGGSYYYDSTVGVEAWTAGAFTMYYRILSAGQKRKWHLFEFEGAMYAIDQPADGTASVLLINGDRGKTTNAGATYITDSNKSWPTGVWIGYYVKIVSGKGAGQMMEILDNSSNTLAFGANTWDTIPDTSSEYVICHTDIWQDISPASGDQIDAPCTDVCAASDIVYFAFGQGQNILRMQWNAGASPPAHQFADDGTNKADLIFSHFDATNDNQVYVANTAGATVDRSPEKTWGSNLVLVGAFDVGNSDLPITSLYAHDGSLYAFKPDGRYLIKVDDSAEKTLGEIGFSKSRNNGQASLSYGLYSYFSWGGYALQRLYDSSGTYDLSNVGPDKDEGLPDDRKGPIVALLGTPPGIMALIDGGDDNYSSILVQPSSGYGWHEVLRGYAAGKRIQNMYFQDSYRPRLWCDMGGELVYQDWPRHSFNPLKDSGITYMPEAVLVSSTIDMGVSNLPKFMESLTLAVENLATGIEVQLDYQVNEDVDTDNWIWAGTFQINPFDDLEINQGEVYQMRFRLRLYTNDESTPPVVNATVLEGYARTPIKYQWNMRLEIGSTLRDLSGVGRNADPDEFMEWIKDCARSSRRIFMRSVFENMDSKYVIVEPPTLLREYHNKVLGFWGGVVNITVREK